MNWIDFLNKNSGAIQSLTTIILVIVTAIYVYFTYQMSKTMAKQAVSDIVTSDQILGSSFVGDSFKERLKESTEKLEDSWFPFRLLFDVRNRSSGSGSIDKPTLLLKFSNDGFECRISPETKSRESRKIDASTSEIITTDLGGTIFLLGGDSKKIELEYPFYKFDKSFIDHLKRDFGFLEYYMEFHDNLGKKHVIKICDIRGEREVYRL